jgi:3-hydroxyisobutyrate dehydrogenase-like beta-hydroxyacid dehydrogenase
MRLALIGTGMMGERIGRRLLDAGHELAVHNRTVERTQRRSPPRGRRSQPRRETPFQGRR